MNKLRGFRFHQLVTVPAAAAGEQESARGWQAALFAALTAAHPELLREEGPAAGLAVAWDRRPAQRAIRVLVGGNPRFPPVATEAGELRVLYPPGTTARNVDDIVDQWAQLPFWVRCGGRADSLWSADSPVGKTPLRGCFEDYIAHLPGAFVWLVVAEPLPDTDVEAELAELEVRLPRLRARENSEPDRIALQRGEARYRELSRARSAGMWRVHVLVGGPDETSTARAAGLLCSSSDLDALPYVLSPQPDATTLKHAWESTTISGAGFASPFNASGELLAALARPPRRELPGIRVCEPVAFDLTPERNGQIDLGAILDDADTEVGRFGVDLHTLNRHGFVAGATGSGKSQTVRHLLEGLHAAGVPWLVIEPAKAEYARMAGRIDSPVIRIRPGNPDAVPVGLNPLEPEPGFALQTHIDLVRALFLAAFDAVEPFPQVLAHALSTCYTNLGWDTVIGAPRHETITPRYPTLSDLQTTALSVVNGIGYGREITDNVRGFIDVRLSALRLGTPGQFFEGGYHLDVADLLLRNVVLEIEDIGSDTDKAFFIGVILIRVFEHLRVHRTETSTALRHVMVVEEAHRLLRRAEQGTPAAHAVELFTALLAEIRAYGEGILVAEQIPTKISPDVVKNTALKIVHRLPAAEDRDLVGATMNLDPPQSRHLVSLSAGRAVVFTDGMDRPIRIDVPLGESREACRPAPTPTLFPVPDTMPLTLRDLHHAHALADDPRLTVWVELMVIAHLVGRPSPGPNPDWLSAWTAGTKPATLAEAVNHRIRTAIDQRYTGLAIYFPPEQLAEHLSTLATAALRHTGTACSEDETQWQAGRYRWADVEYALHDPAAHPDRPHPATDVWAQRGLHLPGTTLAEQRDLLHDHPDNWADPDIVTGPDPMVLATSIERLSHAHSIEQRLRHATTHLNGITRWPLSLFEAPDNAPTPPQEKP